MKKPAPQLEKRVHTRDRHGNAERPPLWSRRWHVGSRSGQVSWLTARSALVVRDVRRLSAGLPRAAPEGGVRVAARVVADGGPPTVAGTAPEYERLGARDRIPF